MKIPTLWHPFPEDTDCWDRYFRAGVEYPLNITPSIQGWCDRTYVTSQGPKTERTASMDVSASLTELMSDPELAQHVPPLVTAMTAILYILWTRKVDPAPEE